MTRELMRLYFGAVLALGQACVLSVGSARLLLRVAATDTLDAEAREEAVGYHCYRGGAGACFPLLISCEACRAGTCSRGHQYRPALQARLSHIFVCLPHAATEALRFLPCPTGLLTHETQIYLVAAGEAEKQQQPGGPTDAEGEQGAASSSSSSSSEGEREEGLLPQSMAAARGSVVLLNAR